MNNSNSPKPKRRWFQYSLRMLLVLVTLFAIACSWYAVEMQKAAKRRAAIAEITRLGGGVSYYDASNPYTAGKPPEWFSWLRKLHGDERLGNVVAVYFGATRSTDDGLVHLKRLTNLKWLLCRGEQITDAGLVHLRGLTQLTYLDLANTQITDAGLVHLKGLTKLEGLDLSNTGITDGGLAHVRDLPNLRMLCLRGTEVSDERIKRLRQALPKCHILD